MSNTYFVTGAAGFIGANFVNHLIDKYSQNVEITIFDSLTYAGNLESIASLLQLPNVRFVKADICDPVAVAEALAHSNPDFIVNFAAESHVIANARGNNLRVWVLQNQTHCGGVDGELTTQGTFIIPAEYSGQC